MATKVMSIKSRPILLKPGDGFSLNVSDDYSEAARLVMEQEDRIWRELAMNLCDHAIGIKLREPGEPIAALGFIDKLENAGEENAE